MTYEELGAAIGRLSASDKQRQAVVFPPNGCPHDKPVPVSELGVVLKKGNRTNVVTILTGRPVD
jgi:hypothetical protein